MSNTDEIEELMLEAKKLEERLNISEEELNSFTEEERLKYQITHLKSVIASQKIWHLLLMDYASSLTYDYDFLS